MNGWATPVAVINLAFCLLMAYFSLKQRRLTTVYWFLISYFSIFFCGLTVTGPFEHLRGFAGDYIKVQAETIYLCVVYAFFFNVLFALSEQIVWRLFSGGKTVEWTLPRSTAVNAMRLIFGVMLVVSLPLYFIKMRGLGYRGYVEYTGSNWPSVFFMASSVFIVLSALQRKYWLAFLATVPFLYFGFVFRVRSLALYSLIPALLVVFFQISVKDGRLLRKRALWTAAICLAMLLSVSLVSDRLKGAGAGLPDSGMPYGMATMVQKTEELHHYMGMNSLHRYFVNLFMPFYKLFQLKLPTGEDTPTYMAWLIDGVPRSYRVFFHYPALVYTDAFISFGKAGVFLGLLWGAIASLMEAAMARHRLFLGVYLPIYTFHTYMICRGAIAIAAVPFTYHFYVITLVMMAVAILPSKRSRS